jgi:hypothetical protein
LTDAPERISVEAEMCRRSCGVGAVRQTRAPEALANTIENGNCWIGLVPFVGKEQPELRMGAEGLDAGSDRRGHVIGERNGPI